MEQNRYIQLAQREAEQAERELERSRGAWLYALSQENDGLRDHFIRIAAQARFAWTTHQRMAKHFEARAEQAAPDVDEPEVTTPTSRFQPARPAARR